MHAVARPSIRVRRGHRFSAYTLPTLVHLSAPPTILAPAPHAALPALHLLSDLPSPACASATMTPSTWSPLSGTARGPLPLTSMGATRVRRHHRCTAVETSHRSCSSQQQPPNQSKQAPLCSGQSQPRPWTVSPAAALLRCKPALLRPPFSNRIGALRQLLLDGCQPHPC
jgi:hypothetical protein